jgi:hypothetical protein
MPVVSGNTAAAALLYKSGRRHGPPFDNSYAHRCRSRRLRMPPCTTGRIGGIDAPRFLFTKAVVDIRHHHIALGKPPSAQPGPPVKISLRSWCARSDLDHPGAGAGQDGVNFTFR